MKTNHFLRVVESFAADGTEGCWEWPGRINPGGYATVSYFSRERKRMSMLAHRLAFMLLVRPLKEGELVCHSCDNRKCVRPDHLWPGTTADNAHDRDRKGRGMGQRPACGNGHVYAEVGFTLAAKGRGGVLCRVCKQCARERAQRFNARKRAAAPPAPPRIPKTHCKRGHPLSGDNITLTRLVNGYVCRCCRTCAAMRYQLIKARVA